MSLPSLRNEYRPNNQDDGVAGLEKSLILESGEEGSWCEIAAHERRNQRSDFGLRWTSSCIRGESPIALKLWTSPALITKMSPAPPSNVFPSTVQRPRPSRMNCISS